MAAVLCNGLGKICSTSCTLLTSILTLPCKACGLACEGLSAALRSPFCIYLSVTAGLNLPPIVFAVQAYLINGDDGCDAVWRWLLVNTVLCAVNVIAAIYISWKIAYDTSSSEEEEEEGVTTTENDATTTITATATAIPVVDVEAAATNDKMSEIKVIPVPVPTTPEPTNNNNNATTTTTTFPFEFQSPNRAKSLSRVRDVLCHDPIVALYILAWIWYIVWQSLGITSMNQPQDECGSSSLVEVVSESVMFGFLFISLGAISFCCSVCCLR